MFSRNRSYFALVLGFFFFTFAPPSAHGAKLYVVYASIGGTQAIGWVAKEAGLFAKDGLDVELLFTGGGRAITSLLSGDTPLITVGGPSVISARLAGSDAIITAHIFDTILYSLMVQPDIRTLADLKGKKLGASRFGSATDFALRYVLKLNGLDPKDFVIFQIGGQSETLAALKAGSINGGVIASPATAEARRLGMRELINMGTLGIEYPQTTIATTERFLRSSRETVVRFTRAYVEGAHRFLNDREFSLKVIGKYTKIQSRPTLEATYDDYAPYVKKIPTPTAGSIKTVLEQLSATDPKARSARPQEFIDGSVVSELEQQGFFKQIWR
ncbi:MAG TPA: ABC transporter substrate-binding protein [Methylomirabilota bacterium]|nr:ABC transporter substrate-binding protein [Methylomirabilota bacterium]